MSTKVSADGKTKTVKVDVHDGVYLDPKGNYLHVELGESDVGEERVPAIRLTGPHEHSEEGITFVIHMRDARIVEFCMMINECEYLGEL